MDPIAIPYNLLAALVEYGLKDHSRANRFTVAAKILLADSDLYVQLYSNKWNMSTLNEFARMADPENPQFLSVLARLHNYEISQEVIIESERVVHGKTSESSAISRAYARILRDGRVALAESTSCRPISFIIENSGMNFYWAVQHDLEESALVVGESHTVVEKIWNELVARYGTHMGELLCELEASAVEKLFDYAVDLLLHIHAYNILRWYLQQLLQSSWPEQYYGCLARLVLLAKNIFELDSEDILSETLSIAPAWWRPYRYEPIYEMVCDKLSLGQNLAWLANPKCSLESIKKNQKILGVLAGIFHGMAVKNTAASRSEMGSCSPAGPAIIQYLLRDA